MLKKLLSFMLVALIMVSAVPVSFAEKAPEGVAHPVVGGWYLRYKEDFEDKEVGTNLTAITGWSQPSSNYQSAEVAKESESSDNKVAKITRTYWYGHDEHIFYSLPTALSGEVYAEMRIYLSTVDDAGERGIMIMDGNKNIASYIYIGQGGIRKVTADNKVPWYNNDLMVKAESLGWHTVGVKLDYDSCRATLVIDNVVKSDITEMIDFTNPKLGGIGINGGINGDTTNAIADDICIYTKGAPSGISHPVVDDWYVRYKEDFEGEATGTELAKMTGWTQNGSTYQNQSSSVVTDTTNENNKVAKTTRTNWRGNDNYAYYSLPKALDGKVYVEMKVYLAGTGYEGQTAIMLFDGNKNITTYLASSSDGFYNIKPSVGETGGSQAWVNNDLKLDVTTTPAWHTYGILLDYDVKNAKLVIDNVIKSDITPAIDFTNSNLGGVGINGGLWGDDVTWMHDDICVYTEEAPEGVDHHIVNGWYAHYDIDFEDAYALRGQSVNDKLGWKEQNPTYTAVDTTFEEDPANSKNTALRIKHNQDPNGAYENAEYPLESILTGRVYFETRMYKEGANAQGNITFYDKSGNKAIEIYNHISSSENSWRYYNEEGKVIWVHDLLSKENTWFTLGVLFDLENMTFDLYENGVKRNSAPLPMLSDNIATISFNRYRYDAATEDNVYFDDIKVLCKKEPVPCCILDIIMTDAGGEFVNEAVLGGKITGVKIRKRTEDDNAVVFVAAYQNDKLVGVQSANVTSDLKIGVYQVLPIDITLPTAEDGELKVKAFVWKNRKNMIPLAEAYEIKDKKITLFVAGDSITHNYNSISSYPMKGYGQVLQNYLDDEGVTVDNRGLSGRSTKSYIAEGALDGILKSASSGDYITIQFGHNDQDSSDPSRGTTIDEYKVNLRYYVSKAKEIGVNPIFVIPPVRRLLENDNTLYSSILGEYPEAMIAVAKELGVPYIDLYTKTETLVNDMEKNEAGSSKKLYMILDANDSAFFAPDTKWTSSPFYTSSKEDNTHFNKYGANVLAHMISEELASFDELEISKYATPDETDPETAYSAE